LQHPSIYEVTVDDGENTYTRVNDLETSPYYRWDKSPGLDPPTEAFPKDFHMIAYSDQQGANKGGETGGNLFIECCNISNGEESCTSTTGGVVFPKKKCDFLGIAFGELYFCEFHEVMSVNVIMLCVILTCFHS